MEKTKFIVSYDGEAHADHEIDIMTLGNSLSSLGTLLYETNEVLNQDRSSITIKINAEFVEGSFGVEVELIQSLIDAKDILTPLGIMGAGTATGTVVAVINWLRGEEITAVEQQDDSTQIFVGGDHITCPKEVAALVSNPRVRQAFEGVVRAPLQSDGTESVSFRRDRNDDAPALEITKSQSESFTRLSVKPVDEEDTVDARVKFTAANVMKKTGWQILVGGTTVPVSAKMEDDAFRERLMNQEENYVFGRHFDVKLKIKVRKALDSEKKTYTILSVKHEVKAL